MIEVSIRVKESDLALTKAFQKEAVPYVNKIFFQAIPFIKKVTRKVLDKHIRQQPEWDSLVHGELKLEFGLTGPKRRMENIIFEWLHSINYELRPLKVRGTGYSGGIKIWGITAGFGNVTSLDSAKVFTEKGDILPWLRWLLLDGSRDLILGYDVGIGQGRAGNRIMIETKSHNWGVPSRWQGTKQDNFILRAIKSAEPELQLEIEKIFNDL